MVLSVDIALTESLVQGLFSIQRYRFLTINQFARVSGLHHSTAADKLYFLSQVGVLAYFGNTRSAAHGKTPKAYFLTRKGFELLRDCSRAAGFIQLVHDEVMPGFVDGLRLGLHATYPGLQPTSLSPVGYTLSVTQDADLLRLCHLSRYWSAIYWLAIYYTTLTFIV